MIDVQPQPASALKSTRRARIRLLVRLSRLTDGLDVLRDPPRRRIAS
jgi:hypothetical protein